MGLEEEITDPRAVLQAIAEFDESGRSAFLTKHGLFAAQRYVIKHDGRSYDAKAILCVARGYEFPEKGPLNADEVESSYQGVAVPLANLGFEVVTIEGEAGSLDGLSALLENVLVDLHGRVPRSSTSLEDAENLLHWVETDIPALLNGALDDKREARGSIGMGMLADVPWVGVFEKGGLVSAKSGFYLVYLFAADGSSVYLSLNQGTENLHGGLAPLRKRSLDLRDAAGNPEGLLHEIDLNSVNQRPKRYEAGSALALPYARGTVPPDAQLKEDLWRMLAIVTLVEKSGISLDPNLEPLHLLFKWNTTLEPNTVGIHKQIADEKGSVWWGRFGQPGSSGMGQERLADLRRQLDAGVDTHVYLYRSGEVWVCKLEQITNEAEDVDFERLPTYYSISDCNLFVRLSQFEQLAPDWPSHHLVTATKPEPADLRGALSNQTTPLFVYERFSARPHVDTSGVDVDQEAGEGPTIKWLVEQTGWTQDRLESVIASLQDESPQVILQGPPGTGKTWVARLLARYMTNDEPLAYQVVQFHPSYGYEEFVEGLRPEVNDGMIEFNRRNGVILRIASAIAESDETRVLIIDEMNRANLPRVMGELMYLLEYRDEAVDLMYSPQFSLPPKLMIIGTMNTADRSIRSIDIALRRRFDIFDCPPDVDVLKHFYESHANDVGDALFSGFEELNKDLLAELDRHHLIGHTFFMANPMTNGRLGRAWELQVGPIIEEYFLDQPDIGGQFTYEKYFGPNGD
jgi:5-methylcytosine-specific restriction protein B